MCRRNEGVESSAESFDCAIRRGRVRNGYSQQPLLLTPASRPLLYLILGSQEHLPEFLVELGADLADALLPQQLFAALDLINFSA